MKPDVKLSCGYLKSQCAECQTKAGKKAKRLAELEINAILPEWKLTKLLTRRGVHETA